MAASQIDKRIGVHRVLCHSSSQADLYSVSYFIYVLLVTIIPCPAISAPHFLYNSDVAYTSPAQRAAYPYLQKLLALDVCRPSYGIRLPNVLAAINTPLIWQAWAQALQPHPDKDFADYIISGIRGGFRVGFRYGARETTKSCKRNMSSAYEHQKVVTDYLDEECCHSRIAGPFPQPPVPHPQVNSFGVIPKRHQQNKWWLILNLSSPHKHSVNDGIKPNLCFLSYISIDVIAAVILQLGTGALIAKTDVKYAYRQIPMHPEDRPRVFQTGHKRKFRTLRYA